MVNMANAKFCQKARLALLLSFFSYETETLLTFLDCKTKTSKFLKTERSRSRDL